MIHAPEGGRIKLVRAIDKRNAWAMLRADMRQPPGVGAVAVANDDDRIALCGKFRRFALPILGCFAYCIKKLKIYKLAGKTNTVEVNMGYPELNPERIPTTLKATDVKGSEVKAVVNRKLTVQDKEYAVTCVNFGNPHCVVFCDFVDKIPLAEIGPLFENNKVFPERINTEFVRVVGPNELKMRTWERGNGETPACGTGACAAVVAAVLNGYCKMNENITVEVRGGKLSVMYDGKDVYLSGTTEMCFSGEVEI